MQIRWVGEELTKVMVYTLYRKEWKDLWIWSKRCIKNNVYYEYDQKQINIETK